MFSNADGSWFLMHINYPDSKSIFLIKVSGSKFIFINLSPNV